MPSRRSLVSCLLLLACLVAAPSAQAHKGSPNYLSIVRGVTPAVPGLSVVMLNRDDRLLVTNRGPRTVVFEGYEDEPYLRFLPTGVVQRNVLSPSTYLNDDRTGAAPVPKIADSDAEPRWETVSQDGKFEFHDHRIHWMGANRPPAVTNPDKRTKVNDWSIPFRVEGSGAGTVEGTLYWTPIDGGGLPVGAIAGLAVVLLGGVALVLVVRRRRAAAGGPDDVAAGTGGADAEREAW